MLSLKKYINLQIKKILYRNSLQKIGECTGSDKVYGHNFIPIYEVYFKSLRKKPLNILEVGIGGYEDPQSGGESLLMWSEYFKNAKIVGADLFEKHLKLPKRVQTIKLDQSNPEELDKLGNSRGGFDIIIDDGSHVSHHVILTFQTLWKYLNHNGLYIIEDYKHPNYYKYNRNIDHLLVDQIFTNLNNKKTFISNIFNDDDQKELIKSIKRIETFKGNLNDSDISFITKA